MSDKTSTLQQRAQLLSILNKYRDIKKIDNNQLREDINSIRLLENKELIFKTLLQEIVSSKGMFCDICSIISIEAFENEIFEEFAVKLLQDKKIEDEKKFLIMSLMRQKGLNFNYRDIVDYVENPQELAHNGVGSFLNNAIYDPEVQIDLFINIPQDEKLYFLGNLQDEFCGDDLANAFSILAQLNLENEELEIVLNSLLESNSCYAINGLKHILETQGLEVKIKTKIKKEIKKLEKTYPDFKNDLLTLNSEVYKCYISFVDGKSNFSLIFSRKTKNNLIHALLFTVNTKKGITSCMGFCDLEIENFIAITKRLFSDSLPVNISPIALKSLYTYYCEKSKKNNIELPYEFTVWKNMLNDVRVINYDISEFINSKLELTKLTKAKVKKFVSSKILETWYYSIGQNEHIDKLIDEIEKKHIVDLDKINEMVSKLIDDKFLIDREFISEMQSKLLMQSYVASLAKLKMTSACAYSLCYKNPYTKMLIESSIDKSLYYAFSTKAYELDDDNVFKKNSKSKFKKEELELLMAQLEEKWS